MTDANKTSPVWLITGCSTGFGRALAEVALERGMRVAATARSRAALADLQQRFGEQMLSIELDVTRPDKIDAAVRDTLATFGYVDVLVNNAGYGYMAAVEEGVDEEVRALFDTNFFGAVNLIKAVLPSMRARRSGYIVNITSVRGHAGNGGSGYYSATKFALEGLSESLKRETAEFGIHVVAVAPGSFRTDWAGRSLQCTSRSIDDYTFSGARHLAEVAKRVGRQPGDPVRAAHAIIDALASPDLPIHLVLGKSGIKLVRDKIQALNAELDRWERVAEDCDYPA
jgi:NAD(P)-dependent dehydrogenase (short-subunit alcohol dehydrogenase family)